jgi:ParB/RepB/Spo0J family partition protein
MTASGLEIVDIPHARLEPDPANPNEMTDAEVKALTEEIRLHGFVQPILVRPNGPDRWRIIDGEHRWRILGELGAETVPCVVEHSTDVDGKARMLTMNRLRGQFVPVKLAHLLADLRERVPDAELRSRLAMDPQELQNYLDVAGYLDEPEPPPPPERGGQREGVEVAVVCSGEQAERMQKLLDAATGGKPEAEARVIIEAARK